MAPPKFEKETRPNRLEFWNRKAKTFPRYSPGENTYEAGVLQLAKDNGAVFAGARVLDVGAGTGLYTVRIAQEAQEVVAVDFSSEMLAILEEDAAKLNLTNIKTHNIGWLEFPLNGEFNVVYCSMCPAMGQPGGLEKVLTIPKAQVVYLGWNGLLRSNVLTGLYETYKVTPKTFDSAGPTRAFLDENKVKYTTAPVEGTWRVRFSLELLTDSVVQNLSDYGVEPDLDQITSYLKTFQEPDGQCVEVTDYKIQMILWRNS
ncbi:MAG: class I SAM-dependent methyltransferase [Deltaproteobacteria bacterium]|jgi:SAM-dependent methyltransferase|nr:class I SAM-dependent methyltransferase [Deltaproteobacteria bacterium]